MANNPTLVVLAAGLGSRYGGLKQLSKLGPNGETILDYTIYDGIQAGFRKVVFVINENIGEEFERTFDCKLDGRAHTEYVFQRLDDLPEGFQAPPERKKPWGTAHAVLTAAPKVSDPFAIINADDFYGRSSLKIIFEHLLHLDNARTEACLIGFILMNTLSDHGKVSRGICDVDAQNNLARIVERTAVYKKGQSGAYFEENGQKHDLTGKEIVSMNLMGFTSKIFGVIHKMFVDFLQTRGMEEESEFFIPSVLDHIRKKGVEVPVFTSGEQWFGVTYKGDGRSVRQRMEGLTKEGVYPTQLWL